MGQLNPAPFHTAWAAAIWLCAIVLANTPALADGFVRTQGTRFEVDGSPFFVTGVNNHYLTYGSEAETVAVLDDAVAMGANVVRTFLQPVIGSLDGQVTTIWDWKSTADSSNLGVHGNYLLYWDSARQEMAVNPGPRGMQKVDFLLAEARKRHLRLILAFLDFWSYTGGAQQMRAWYGNTDQHHFFFANPFTRADYRQWVQFVVERVNLLTGDAYRDDPTIFSWELMNEPEIKPSSLHDSWVVEMSDFIKLLDPSHMVSSGQDRLNPGEFEMQSIDFLTWHGYPLYFGLDPQKFDALIRSNCELAHAHAKPILLEEFGYARSNANPDQAQAYAQWLATMADNPDCAGWVVWRLVSRQDNGHYPADAHDQFDVHNDDGQTWQVLSRAAHDGRASAR